MELGEEAIRSIVAHFARLRAEHGEAFADPDLVEPNGDYFPDDFERTPDGVEVVMRRMLTYAPLSEDLDVQLAFAEPDEGAAQGGGCGSGACGTGGAHAGSAAVPMAVETNDGYAVVVSTATAGDPVMLTTSLARSAGRLVMFEAGDEVDGRDEAAVAELTAVASGLGVLLLKGACVYKKGCGGMRMHQATHLGVDELSLALALFVRVGEKKTGAARKHLEVTQREAFDAALTWVDSQPRLVATLRDDPSHLTDGVFELEAKKGLLGRLFSRSPRKVASEDAFDAPPPSARRERSEDEKRRIAEAKALVEAALGE